MRNGIFRHNFLQLLLLTALCTEQGKGYNNVIANCNNRKLERHRHLFASCWWNAARFSHDLNNVSTWRICKIFYIKFDNILTWFLFPVDTPTFTIIQGSSLYQSLHPHILRYRKQSATISLLSWWICVGKYTYAIFSRLRWILVVYIYVNWIKRLYIFFLESSN